MPGIHFSGHLVQISLTSICILSKGSSLKCVDSNFANKSVRCYRHATNTTHTLLTVHTYCNGYLHKPAHTDMRDQLALLQRIPTRTRNHKSD